MNLPLVRLGEDFLIQFQFADQSVDLLYPDWTVEIGAFPTPDRVRRGLEQALGFAKGEADQRTYCVNVPGDIDVRAIRRKLGMMQAASAGRRVRRAPISW